MLRSKPVAIAATAAAVALYFAHSRRTARLRWWLRQRYLSSFLIERDLAADFGAIRLVGGVDISFIKDSETDACAALVVVDTQTLTVVYEAFRRVKLTAPYIPGYLAFREVGFLLELINELKRSTPDSLPEAILVDGNGILHPNRFGIASHLGVLSGIPTVGIGKTLHHVDGLTKGHVKALSGKLTARGDHTPLIGSSGATWGALLRTTDPVDGGNFNPIIVSVGHGICLDSAVALARRCTLKRIPEPVRQADLRSREWLRRHGALGDSA